MVTRARISPPGRHEPTKDRRVKFDHRLLLIVLACVYLPLLAVLLWATVERAS